MACIYAVDRQLTDDMAVWVKYRQRHVVGSNLGKVLACECALGFRCEFDPRSGLLRSVLMTGAIVDRLLGLFLTGANM